MKEVFLGKKSVSNQRSLAQSDQELALVTEQFIQAVKKMVEAGALTAESDVTLHTLCLDVTTFPTRRAHTTPQSRIRESRPVMSSGLL
jgi:hypothetical protein